MYWFVLWSFDTINIEPARIVDDLGRFMNETPDEENFDEAGS